MNIGIVGSNGYIAGYLIKGLSVDHSIVRFDCVGNIDEKLDLRIPKEFDYSLLTGTDVIIFTAAVSEPDKCANEFDLSWSINVAGTNYFIKQALEHNCKALFFSSDAVFGDIPGMIYDEDSETKASTPYGRMKKAVEDENKDNPNFKCIRLSYVASAKDRFISYCFNCIKSGETADIFHPFYRNCIVVSDVVKVVDWLINHWDEYEPYVLDVTGMELISRVRMADEINRIFDNRLKYTISDPGEGFYKNRPMTTQMTSKYLWSKGILKNETFTEKIQRELKGVEI